MFKVRSRKAPLWSIMMSHYYEFQVLWFPDSLSLLLWHSGESGEICVCMCVCVCALICVKGVCWRKEVWTKKGGSIIGFSTARRHNDTAIDSGMSSRERWTNGRAGACFSQPLIGWPREAVGLQVAKWTLEHICHPFASWEREGGKEGELDVEEEMWPKPWREENNGFTRTQHIISYTLYVSSSLLHQNVLLLSFPLTQTCVCVCVCAHAFLWLLLASTLPGLWNKFVSFVFNLAEHSTASLSFSQSPFLRTLD